jgi:hypothetical protein
VFSSFVDRDNLGIIMCLYSVHHFFAVFVLVAIERTGTVGRDWVGARNVPSVDLNELDQRAVRVWVWELAGED